MSKPLRLTGDPLKLEDVRDVAYGRRSVSLSEGARAWMRRSRSVVERLLAKDSQPHYGINTGFGSLKNVRIDRAKVSELQLNLIRSHAVGMGPALDEPVVRSMMLLRAHTISLGYSGVRPEVVELLLAMLNAGVIPVVPCQGSVGASGDLSPLAHLALGLVGEGDVTVKGKRMKAAGALRKAGLKPLRPEAKEALALLNGTQMMTAIGCLALLRAENALRHADVAAAMTLEGTQGSFKAFDARVHAIRPHPGQKKVAENLRALTAESAIAESHADCDRVQDAYSIRCSPQVHGAARDAAAFVRGVLEREINSVTDNPLVFPEENEIISAGNFHGQPVATAMDILSLALTSTASISERRISRLLWPGLSELSPGLTREAGLHSGLMMTQVAAASLVNECKTLSHPASVDSIPTWADQEDHVSMGAFAARKAETIVENLEKIVAIELLCAAQALDLRRPLEPAKAVGAARREIRKRILPLKGDRVLSTDMEEAVHLLRSERLLRAVEGVTGELN